MIKNKKWNEFLKIFQKDKSDSFKKKLKKFINAHKIHCNNSLLVGEMGGYEYILIKNAILSIFMKLRGYKPVFIICDGVFQVCIQRGLELNEDIDNCIKSEKKCHNCFDRCKKQAERYGVEYIKASTFINETKLREFEELSQNISFEKIRDYKYLDVDVGALAFSSFNRYMKGYVVDIKDIKPEFIHIYRKYFRASLINTFIANEAVKNIKPSVILTSHGVYIDYAPLTVIGIQRDIPTISWSSGYADFMHYFVAHKKTEKLNLREISSNSWNKIKQKAISQEQTEFLDSYFCARYIKGEARDIPNFNSVDAIYDLKRKLNLNNDNKIVCLFAHVSWDAVFELSCMVFETPNEWVIESIKKMIEIKDVNWIIRTHPGELMDGSLFTTYDLIKQNFDIGKLPNHIKILSHKTDINSYDIYKLIDCGITIFGTVGTELPCMGKSVIAIGNSHFSNKGFTYDVKTKDEYFTLLNNISEITPLNEQQIELAKKYAYLYFIQRQVSFYFMNRTQGHWGDLDLNKLEESLPGNSPIIDRICDGLIKGEDIILSEDDLAFLENEKKNARF